MSWPLIAGLNTPRKGCAGSGMEAMMWAWFKQLMWVWYFLQEGGSNAQDRSWHRLSSLTLNTKHSCVFAVEYLLCTTYNKWCNVSIFLNSPAISPIVSTKCPVAHHQSCWVWVLTGCWMWSHELEWEYKRMVSQILGVCCSIPAFRHIWCNHSGFRLMLLSCPRSLAAWGGFCTYSSTSGACAWALWCGWWCWWMALWFQWGRCR